MSLPAYHNGDPNQAHEDAMKWLIRVRLSHILSMVDKQPSRTTARSLGRLLADVKSYLDGLTP